MPDATLAAERFQALLADPSARIRFLFIPQGYDSSTGTVRPFYFCDPGPGRSYTTRPDEVPANAIFQPLLLAGRAVLDYARSMYSDGDDGVMLGGRSFPGQLTVELDNPGGRLDHLKQIGFDGYPALILAGGVDFAFAEHQPVALALIAGQPQLEEDRLVFLCEDLKGALDVDVQLSVFAGTGDLEGGSDLAGKRKPRCWGVNRNIEPVALGLIHRDTAPAMPGFLFNDGPVAPHDAELHRLRIAGVLIPYDATFPPAEGKWSFDHATSLTLVNGPVPGRVTMDVLGDASEEFDAEIELHALLSAGTGVPGPLPVEEGEPDFGDPYVLAALLGLILPEPPDTGGYVDTLAGIARRIAVAPGGITLSSVNHAALAVTEAMQPAPCGLYAPEGGNRLDLLDALASPLGAWFGADRSGMFHVSILTAPEDVDLGYLENLLAAGTGIPGPPVDLAAAAPGVLETLLGIPYDAGYAAVALRLHPGNLLAPPKSLAMVIPPWRLTLGYQPNHTPQDASELADIYDEAVTNPRFVTDSDWNKGTGWTISGGEAHAAAGTESDFDQDLTLAAGDDWVALVKLNVTADAFTVLMEGEVLADVEGRTALDESGTYRFEFTAAGTLAQTLAIRKSAAAEGTVQEVRVRLKRFEFVTEPFRTAAAEDLGIRTRHRRSQPLRIDTRLDRKADAAAEAARQLALYGKRPDGSDREIFRCTTGLPPLRIDLGALVELTHPRFGLADGRRMRVIEIAESQGQAQTDLTLWG